MIDYSKITQNKYLDFFTSEKTKTIERPNIIMDEFLCDMEELAENMPSDVSPKEAILNAFENNKALFETKGELFGFTKICMLANSDNIKTLSELELLALLWYCSCRNFILYEEGYYVSMTSNGVIGRLLSALIARGQRDGSPVSFGNDT